MSIRLPVHVMARLRALEDIFPTRTRTELIGDLLSSALDDVVYGLPMYKGEPHGPGPDGEDLFEVLGAAKQFRDRANKHFADIEKELGNKDAPPLFPGTYVAEQSDFED
ncbi:MAG TPA: hypothetical protein VGH81_03650 [Rudaea sp.]